MSEMQLTADHLVVIGRGRLLADAPIAEVIARQLAVAVRVRSPHAGQRWPAARRLPPAGASTAVGDRTSWSSPAPRRARSATWPHELGVGCTS